MGASAPPAIMAWTSPRRMISQASPTASAPLEQADVAQKFIPLAPSMMDTCPAAASAIIMGTSRGLIRRGPFSARVAIWAESVVMPPMPLPIRTPRSVPSFSVSRLACFTASWLATVANWV